MKTKTKLLAAGLAAFLTFSCTDVMVGTVTSQNLDGHVDWSTHTLAEPFTYISYDGLDCQKGDRMLTIEVYSPVNLEDGICFRKDIKITK